MRSGHTPPTVAPRWGLGLGISDRRPTAHAATKARCTPALASGMWQEGRIQEGRPFGRYAKGKATGIQDTDSDTVNLYYMDISYLSDVGTRIDALLCIQTSVLVMVMVIWF